MNTLIVVVDLGRFRAYRVAKETMGGRKMDLAASRDFPEALERLSEKVTDSAGRFSPARGAGEAHNIESETERRLVRAISQEINALIPKEGNPRWSFAAPEAIHTQILEQLSPGVKALIASNLKVNLTKASKEELLERF